MECAERWESGAFVPILTPKHCPSTQPGPCAPGAPAWAVSELRGGALATTKSPAALPDSYSQIRHRTDLPCHPFPVGNDEGLVCIKHEKVGTEIKGRRKFFVFLC